MTAYGLARLNNNASPPRLMTTTTTIDAAEDEGAAVAAAAPAAMFIDPAFLRAWGGELWARVKEEDGTSRSSNKGTRAAPLQPRELVVALDSLVRLGYRCVSQLPSVFLYDSAPFLLAFSLTSSPTTTSIHYVQAHRPGAAAPPHRHIHSTYNRPFPPALQPARARHPCERAEPLLHCRRSQRQPRGPGPAPGRGGGRGRKRGPHEGV